MKTRIFEILNSVGIGLSGVCEFSAVKEGLLECRAKKRIPAGAKSIIICAFPYIVEKEAPKNISRYAAVRDYHEVVIEYLNAAIKHLQREFPQNEFEAFCDNSPIPEVFAAATAGLGIKGDNGLLITEKHGSFVFLGEIVTDLEIESESRYRECEHCGECLKKCPVGLNKAECLSAVSQKKGELSKEERQRLLAAGTLWGCDICANACEHNKNAEPTAIKEFLDSYRDRYRENEDITSRAYAWRGEVVIKRNFENFKVQANGETEN